MLSVFDQITDMPNLFHFSFSAKLTFFTKEVLALWW